MPAYLPHKFFVILVVAFASAAHVGGQEVKHQPVIPGFERFFTGADADSAKGGKLLLSELNCTSCHHAGDAQKALLLPKQAPILTSVGSRVKHGYLKKFLANPHEVKPGTTMPDLFANMPAQEKEEKIEALAHLLASTGNVAHEALKPNLIAKGHKLFHEVGCVACHGSRDAKGNPAKVLATSVPLTNLKEKYSLPSLAVFLESPHQSRPSGRMPGILTTPEAREVAGFLLQGIPGPKPNLAFAYYEGTWDKLPDFKKLTPNFKGECSGFDLSLAGRSNDYAMNFEGYLKIPADGEYRFWLNSDDGSRLWLDGQLVVDNDGIHAPKTATKTAKLTKGMHPLQVGFFQVGGGVELHVEMEGPNLKKQQVSPHVYLTPQGNPVSPDKIAKDEDFPIKEGLVAKGRIIFAEMGCASCHQLKLNGQEIQPKLDAPALDKIKANDGCLSSKPAKGIPHFGLTPAQSKSLAAGIKECAKPQAALTAKESIAQTLTTFNCYACHTRGKIGGVEEGFNDFFNTAQKEMGEEGRIPPTLDGVGAKLKKTYLEKLFTNGAHDRPYMFTRMPKFGMENVGQLVAAFAAADPSLGPMKVPAFNSTLPKVKADGKHMVGAKAFGCIKCHTFNGQKAEGVQGMDMTLMTERVNHDWFVPYLLDPQKFRPGTRMPTSWPNGQTQLPKLLDGDTYKQIEAVWLYLADGKKASLPFGIGSQFIELVPDKTAIIYRNFVAGGGPRAIAVGYPEHAHLCFDANKMALAMIWQGAFIDAAKHWTDRGVGYQPPLGDNVLNLPTDVPFAVLDNDKAPWPKESAKQQGYKFHGYTIDAEERPTFLYGFKGIEVADFPNAADAKPNPEVQRTFTVTVKDAVPKNLYYRAAVGKIEMLKKGLYQVDGKWKVILDAASAPVIRQVGGTQELLVPVEFKNKTAKIVQQYIW